jgi:Xaa-Pro aminopeptidase
VGPAPRIGQGDQIDLWPEDEISGCFTDMTRTFLVAGEAPAEILRQAALIGEVREALLVATGPGVSCQA